MAWSLVETFDPRQLHADLHVTASKIVFASLTLPTLSWVSVVGSNRTDLRIRINVLIILIIIIINTLIILELENFCLRTTVITSKRVSHYPRYP